MLRLCQSIEEEILLMRELLANLVQEERYLVLGDSAKRPHLLYQRDTLLENLKKIRRERTFLSEESDPNDCELSFLRDQLVALTQRTYDQQRQNELLLEKIPHLLAIDASLAYPSRKKKTTTLLDHE